MIPVKDNIPGELTPIVLRLIIALNILVFLFEISLSTQIRSALFHIFGVVPARYFFPEWAAAAGYPRQIILPLFSYMFLHGGWLHLIFNIWTLWIFADNVEDATGHLKFLIFYILCGVIAALVQIIFNSDSSVPVIGASGAIAGIMGGYLVLYPHAKILTLFPIIIIPYFINLPAGLFLAVWFVIQIFSGIFDSLSGASQGVAWGAHIGGFLAGALLINLFADKKNCKYCYIKENKRYEKKVS
jgi:membrane associated rhomboid family serine protease